MLGYIKLSRSLKQTIKTSIKSNKQWFRVTAYTQPSKFCEHQLWRSVTVVQKVFTPHPVMLQSYSCRVFLALQPPFGSLLHKYNFGSYDFSRSAPRVSYAKCFRFFAGQFIVQFTLSLVSSQALGTLEVWRSVKNPLLEVLSHRLKQYKTWQQPDSVTLCTNKMSRSSEG